MKSIRLFVMALVIVIFITAIILDAGDKKTDTVVKLPAPGKAWELQIDLPGFTTEKGMGQYMGSNEKTGVVISIFLEQAVQEGDSTVCRKYYLAKSPKNPPAYSDIKESEKGDMAIFEYTMAEVGGLPLNQKHLNAYIARDGIWIDIHLSKVRWQETDMPAFEAILNSVRFDNKGVASNCDLKKIETFFKCDNCDMILVSFKCPKCEKKSKEADGSVMMVGLNLSENETTTIPAKCHDCNGPMVQTVLAQGDKCPTCKKSGRQVMFCVKTVYTCPKHYAFESLKPLNCLEDEVVDKKGTKKKCNKKLEADHMVFAPVIYVYDCPKCKQRTDSPGKCETCQQNKIKQKVCKDSGIFPHVDETKWEKESKK